LSDYLSSVEDFVNDIVLNGVSYDSMKTYFGEVHAPWAKGMIAACEKMKEAYRMLDLEIAQKGGIRIHDLITSEYAEDQLKMYALQSLSNAPRIGTYDLEFLHSLENMYLKAGLDYSETDHTIDKKGLEALKECYKNIKLKKSGDWLERGGGDIIAGVTLIAGGMVMSHVGNRSLKIRSEGIGNAGSSKTYSVKRGPKLQGKDVSGKGISEVETTFESQIKSNSYDINKIQKTQPYTYPENVASIKDAIIKQGPNVVPPIEIKVNNGKVLVVDGHHRLEAFRQLGYSRVPIKYIHSSQLGKVLPDGTYYRSLQELLDAANLSN
jgi:hypothetical protein